MSLSVTGLFIYPVKSLAGISLEAATLTDRGLEFDRRWMLIDDNGVFLSQRSFPNMALLRPALEDDQLVIYGTKTGSLKLAKPTTGEQISVQIWDDRCDAILYSEKVNAWFSRELGQSVRLVYMPEESRREVDPRFSSKGEVVSFADGYPFLVISEESLAELNSRLESPVPMNRFRPNIVISGGEAFAEDRLRSFHINDIQFLGVKPCARCQVVTIDQSTAVQSKEPLKTLSSYRRSGNKVLFGMNLLHLGEGNIEVNAQLENIVLAD